MLSTNVYAMHCISTLPINPLFTNEGVPQNTPQNTPQNEPQQTHSAINTKTAANK